MVIPGADGSSFKSDFNAAGPREIVLGVTYTGVAPDDDPFTSATLSLTRADLGRDANRSIEAHKYFSRNGLFGALDSSTCTEGKRTPPFGSDSFIGNTNPGATVTFPLLYSTALDVFETMTLGAVDKGTNTVASLNNGFAAPGTGAKIGGGRRIGHESRYFHKAVAE
jgi:hypothetical protein